MKSAVQWYENGEWQSKQFGAMLYELRKFGMELINRGIDEKKIYIGFDYNKL